MDLVERYIEAVKFWLPKTLKDDIAAELREDITSEIEEAEKKKGSKLSEDEVAELLKARGTPLSVASRYLPQRSLIGPELYPLYIFVLKIVAAICFIPPLLGTFLFHSDPSLPGAFSSPTYSLLMSFAIVTAIFAIMERSSVNPAKSQSWNPKSLRPVADRNRIKRGESVADIIGWLILVGFFLAGYLSITTYPVAPSLLIQHGHGVAFGLSRGHITLAPEWVPYWQFIMVIAVVEIGFAAANLFKPYWTVPRTLLRLALDLVKTAAVCWLFQSHLLREFAVQGVESDATVQLVRLSELAARYAVPGAIGLGLIIVAKAIWRLVRRGQLAVAGTVPTSA